MQRWFGITAVVFVWLTNVLTAKEPTWLRVTAPEFTVITSLPEREAVAWAGDFAQFIGALQGFIPVNPQRLSRLTIVVFARERDFSNYRPLGGDGKPQEVAGFFCRRDSWAVAGLASNAWDEHARTTIFHEGTHWFLSAFELPNPVWLEEGLAEVFSTFEINKKTVSWGRAIDEHVMVLTQQPPMPIERLLFLTQGDLFTGGSEGERRTGMAYAESWAFVHYLIFGKNELPPGAIMNYVRKSRTAMHPDDAFRQAFGQDYASMDRKLWSYLRGGTYYVSQNPLTPAPPLHAVPATKVEFEEALARLCLTARRRSQALEHANRVLAAAENNPVAFELLGEIHQEDNDTKAALAAFEKAVENKSEDFRPYFELAHAQHNEAVQLDGSLGQISAEDARKIANGYERAINLNPRYLPAYQSLAGVVELVPPGNLHDAAFIEQGLLLYPKDGMIRLATAILARRAGDKEKANTLLAEILDPEKSELPQVRAYARRLETNWVTKDVFAEVNALAQAQKFSDALTLVDRRLQENSGVDLHRQLREMRRSLQNSSRYQSLQTAWEDRDWPEARRLLTLLLESDSTPMLKAQLRKRLEELDRRGLGKPSP